MQHLSRILSSQSACAFSNRIAVCSSYHIGLQQQCNGWNQHTQHRSYSYQTKHFPSPTSNPLWHRHSVKNTTLLNVRQAPTGRRTKMFEVEVISSYNGPIYIPSPVEFTYEYLELINESYPWWVVIPMVAVVTRTLLVAPFTLWQHRIAARIENVQPEINTRAEQLRQKVVATAKVQKWSQQEVADEYGQKLRNIINEVHQFNRCEPRKLFYVGVMHMAVWSTFTVVIGQMTGWYPDLFAAEPDVDYLPSLCDQGVLWFKDLTQSSYTLAMLYGGVNLTLTELWSVRRGPLRKTQDIAHHAFRGVSLGMTVVAACMPSAVTLYWLSSSVIGLGYFTLLKSIPARRLLDIAETPSEMKHPWVDTKKALKAKYSSKNSKKHVM